ARGVFERGVGQTVRFELPPTLFARKERKKRGLDAVGGVAQSGDVSERPPPGGRPLLAGGVAHDATLACVIIWPRGAFRQGLPRHRVFGGKGGMGAPSAD